MVKPLLQQFLLARMGKVSITQICLTAACISFGQTVNADPAMLPDNGASVRSSKTALDRTITGKVTDESNSPLPGVSVIIKGTQRGTITDPNGQYRLDVPDGGGVTLVFSFVGYMAQEVVVGNQSAINLSLKADNKMLDEIVVIGYGTTRAFS